MNAQVFVVVRKEDVSLANERLITTTVLNRVLKEAVKARAVHHVTTLVPVKTKGLVSDYPINIIGSVDSLGVMGVALRSHLLEDTDYVVYLDGLAAMFTAEYVEMCLSAASKDHDAVSAVDALHYNNVGFRNPTVVPHCIVRHISRLTKTLCPFPVLVPHTATLRACQYTDIAVLRQLIENEELSE